eukprot:scaffold121590_cov75-Phaeocystis_antarctica.AAC.1
MCTRRAQGCSVCSHAQLELAPLEHDSPVVSVLDRPETILRRRDGRDWREYPLDELLVVDDAGAIWVDLGDHLVQLLLGQAVDAQVADDVPHLAAMRGLHNPERGTALACHRARGGGAQQESREEVGAPRADVACQPPRGLVLLVEDGEGLAEQGCRALGREQLLVLGQG